MNKSELFLSSRGKLLSLSTPIVMGIINGSPDSFYTKNLSQNANDVKKRIEKMISDGAKILDFGGMSTRPNSLPISIQEEIDRVAPLIEWTRKIDSEIFISLDTYRTEVLEACISYDIDILNDISGAQFDDALLGECSKHNLIYIASHIQGTPTDMQVNPTYQDIITEITDYFLEFMSRLKSLDINQFVFDPGFGFGKTVANNYQLLNIYKNLQYLNVPLMAGISRKSMIWKLLETTPDESLSGSLTAQNIAIMNGANIIRTHDVKATIDSIRIIQAYKEHNQ